jgi:Mrp family chromosome partitioning ATPase
MKERLLLEAHQAFLNAAKEESDQALVRLACMSDELVSSKDKQLAELTSKLQSSNEQRILTEAELSDAVHPHLVHTYTYRVKPIGDKPDNINSCIVVMGGGDGSTVAPMAL